MRTIPYLKPPTSSKDLKSFLGAIQNMAKVLLILSGKNLGNETVNEEKNGMPRTKEEENFVDSKKMIAKNTMSSTLC